MGKKNSLTKNTILLSIGTFMTKGLSFVMVPLYSRWLSVEDYGSFDLLCTYITLLIPVIGLSSTEALFRFSMDVEKKEDKSKYVSNCFAIFLINISLSFFVLLFLRYVFDWKFAFAFLILLVGEALNKYFQGFLRAVKRLDIYSFSSTIASLCIMIYVFLFVRVMGNGLSGIIFGYGLGYLTGNFVIVVWTKYWNYLSVKKISLSGMRDMIAYSYVLIPNSIAWWVINVSDRSIIRLFLGPEANGIYAIANKIPGILSSLFGVFSISWQQTATEMLNDSNRNDYYNAIYNKMTVVLISLCCSILSFNAWFFNVIFDTRYYSGYLYAPILVGGTLFLSISQFYGGLQISFKQPKENGISTVIGAVSNIIIHFALISILGLYAAAVSTILSQMIVCFIRNIRLKQKIDLRFTRQTLFCWIIYFYFMAMSYYITNIYINIVNVVLALLFILIINRSYVIKLLRMIRLGQKIN